MKQRYGEEQIIAILHEAETAVSKAEVYRKYSILEQTYYRWRRQYNEERPHNALGYRTPAEVAATAPARAVGEAASV